MARNLGRRGLASFSFCMGILSRCFKSLNLVMNLKDLFNRAVDH